MKTFSYNGNKNISGNGIYLVRTAKRLSQAALAELMQANGVKIEREAISKIETNDRFIADFELMMFAKVFGVSIEQLIGSNFSQVPRPSKESCILTENDG